MDKQLLRRGAPFPLVALVVFLLGSACDCGTEPPPGTACSAASDCDEGSACVEGRCVRRRGPGEPCSSTSECQGGLVCTDGRCAAAGDGGGGCPSGCDDGDECTIDRCDEATGTCVHEPRDADGDGYGDTACGGDDCDDAAPTVNPGAPERCNEVDDDCDGETDEGVRSSCGDCDPTCTLRGVGPGADEPFDPAGMNEVEPGDDGGLRLRRMEVMDDFLWVPNTGDSTLSRWDAAADPPVERGRYRVGLPAGECDADTTAGWTPWSAACNQPSRVAVDGAGNAYVANRGFGMQGTVTKIAARLEDCVDRNGNGVIDTSMDATPLPWGEDECVLWNVSVGAPDDRLRAVAIDTGDAAHPEGYPWVGGYNPRKLWKLDPDSGAVLEEVDVPVHPYGAVVTADGKLWVGVLANGRLVSVDTTVSPAVVVDSVPFPTSMRSCASEQINSSYGITADARGRIWLAGWNCRDALGFDPASGEWTRVDLTRFGKRVGRGITVDPDGWVWTGLYGSGDQASVVRWRADAFVPGGNIMVSTETLLPPNHLGPSGIGADRMGRIWVAHYRTSQLVRIEPADLSMASFTGPNRVYTYSDFTGSVRRVVIGTGTYQHDLDAGCEEPRWGTLTWEADVPDGASLEFSVVLARSVDMLGMGVSVPVATVPPDAPPVDVGSLLDDMLLTHTRFLRVVVRFRPSPDKASPVLRRLALQWHCPTDLD